MTTPFLPQDIAFEEGRVHDAYADPLTGGAPWTIGVGHTGPEVHPGLVWTDQQIDYALNSDIANCEAGLNVRLPWWTELNDPRQDVLVQMVFQMGIGGVLKFSNTLAAMQRGDFDAAADGMRNSAWAHQTPARVNRLAQQMQTGVRAYS